MRCGTSGAKKIIMCCVGVWARSGEILNRCRRANRCFVGSSSLRRYGSAKAMLGCAASCRAGLLRASEQHLLHQPSTAATASPNPPPHPTRPPPRPNPSGPPGTCPLAPHSLAHHSRHSLLHPKSHPLLPPARSALRPAPARDSRCRTPHPPPPP